MCGEFWCGWFDGWGGRVNYGPRTIDRKGITDRVVLGRITLLDWQVRYR